MSDTDNILVVCPLCGHRSNLPGFLTGHHMRCPGCAGSVAIGPSTAQAPVTEGAAQEVADEASAPDVSAIGKAPSGAERIEFTCIGCGHRRQIRALLLGWTVSCPECDLAQDVVGPDPVAPHAPSESSDEREAPTSDDPAPAAQLLATPRPRARVDAPSRPPSTRTTHVAERSNRGWVVLALVIMLGVGSAAVAYTLRPTSIHEPTLAAAGSDDNRAVLAASTNGASVVPVSHVEIAPAAAPLQNRVTTVQRRDLSSRVLAHGTVAAAAEIEVRSSVDGTVRSLPHKLGEDVAAGTALVQIDPADEERASAEAQKRLAHSRERLALSRTKLVAGEQEIAAKEPVAREALVAAEVRARDTAVGLDRITELCLQKRASAANVELVRRIAQKAQTRVEEARAAVAALTAQQAALERLRLDIRTSETQEQADAKAVEDSRKRLAATTVAAPVSSVIAALYVKVGSRVSAAGGGTPLARVSDCSRLIIDLRIREGDVTGLVVDGPATIAPEAAPTIAIVGGIVSIGPRGDPAAGSGNVSVRVAVRGDAARGLRPGAAVRVTLATEARPAVLAIPTEAIIHRGSATLVRIRNQDGAVSEREVAIGKVSDGMVEIRTGAKEGESVALDQGKP